MDQTTRFNYLVNQFRTGASTREELVELMNLLHNSEAMDSPSVEQSMREIWDSIPGNKELLPASTSKKILDNIIPGGKVIPLKRRYGKRIIVFGSIAAAAVVLIFLFSGNWLFEAAPASQISKVTTDTRKSEPQILPGTNKAELILGDGSMVTLDSTLNGDIISQGNVTVRNINGKIVYVPASDPEMGKTVSYNTLRTPKGGFYQLTLSDGTKLWLNAATSLRYPVTFHSNERTVELNGEAYFEVAKDASKPFRVRVNEMNIEVLGTHFNVMAYDNEKSIKTTLLEGSVRVNAGESGAMLAPGQQAKFGSDKKLEVVNDINTEDVVAWKNGFFQFDRAGLDVLMRQIERWYDVDVVFEGSIQQRTFGGKISRSRDIQDVLKIMELSNVGFRIEDKKIIVTKRTM